MEVGLTLRDKRVKLKIENELDKGLLSKFTPDEIDQINNSLNTMEIDYSFDNLIYQKVIHNIKNKKNYTTVYDIVLSPNNGGFNSNSGYESDKPLIIKQFKINNKIVKKEKKKLDDEPHNSDEEEKVVDGYYVSDKKFLGFFYCFRGAVGLYEFECESNDDMDYFRLNCNDLGNIMKRLTYGSSYKYEIILNGNKIKFLDKDFKYKIENDKIILKGIIDGNKDNYDAYYNDKPVFTYCTPGKEYKDQFYADIDGNVDYDEALRYKGSVEVTFLLKDYKGIPVLDKGLIYTSYLNDRPQNYVWKEVNGELVMQYVTVINLGDERTGDVAVIDGLEVGDKIVREVSVAVEEE
jgi:hypothetical protein